MQLGFSEVNQAGALGFLGLDGPSCVALGVVSSIDVLHSGSGVGSCLFGWGIVWVLVGGEAAMGGCSSTGGALVGWTDGSNGGDCPSKE